MISSNIAQALCLRNSKALLIPNTLTWHHSHSCHPEHLSMKFHCQTNSILGSRAHLFLSGGHLLNRNVTMATVIAGSGHSTLGTSRVVSALPSSHHSPLTYFQFTVPHYTFELRCVHYRGLCQYHLTNSLTLSLFISILYFVSTPSKFYFWS